MVASLPSWQPSLFGTGRPEVDGAFSSLTRLSLDDRSWVDHAPGWMSGSDILFEELVHTLEWGQRRRRMYDQTVDEPRLTAGWRAERDGVLRPAALEEARQALGRRYQITFDSVGVNLYRDGRDSVAWHRDRIPAEVVDPVVALLSLGSARRVRLRPYGGGPSQVFLLGRGDLLVTGGQTQRRFEHSVPKVARAAPRISVAFRHGVRY